MRGYGACRRSIARRGRFGGVGARAVLVRVVVASYRLFSRRIVMAAAGAVLVHSVVAAAGAVLVRMRVAVFRWARGGRGVQAA